MRELRSICLGILLVLGAFRLTISHEDQPLSKIAIHKAVFALDDNAYIKASPSILGMKVSEWATAAAHFFVSLSYYFVNIYENQN